MFQRQKKGLYKHYDQHYALHDIMHYMETTIRFDDTWGCLRKLLINGVVFAVVDIGVIGRVR